MSMDKAHQFATSKRHIEGCNHKIAPCGCTHHDWLTCLAESEHMSRFNAWIIFATACEEEHYGKCACHCHRDKDYQQVSQETWNQRVGRQAVQA